MRTRNPCFLPASNIRLDAGPLPGGALPIVRENTQGAGVTSVLARFPGCSSGDRVIREPALPVPVG